MKIIYFVYVRDINKILRESLQAITKFLTMRHLLIAHFEPSSVFHFVWKTTSLLNKNDVVSFLFDLMHASELKGNFYITLQNN